MKSDYHFKKFRDSDYDSSRAVRKRAKRERNQARKDKVVFFKDCETERPETRGR